MMHYGAPPSFSVIFAPFSKTLTCVWLCVRAEWLHDIDKLCFPNLICIVLRVLQSYSIMTFDSSVCLAPCLQNMHFLLCTSSCISFSRSTFPHSVKHFMLKTPVSNFASTKGHTTQEFLIHFQHCAPQLCLSTLFNVMLPTYYWISAGLNSRSLSSLSIGKSVNSCIV